MATHEKSGLFYETNPRLSRRLRQFFIGTQVAAAAGILNLILYSNNLFVSDNLFFLRIDLLAVVFGIAATTLLSVRLGRGSDQKAITLFLWLWGVIIVLASWFDGGLSSTLLLTFPILFMFSALFAETAVFIAIGSFLSIAIIFMGVSQSYGWIIPAEGLVVEGVSKIICALAISGAAGYVCWVFGGLLRSSFNDLKLEHNRVIQSQGAIRKLAYRDVLTGSMNRMGAEFAYKRLLKEGRSNNKSVIAYFIDLDDFKNINDLFDHHVGDQLLVTISDRLTGLLNHKGFVCRFGGDEFVLAISAHSAFDLEGFADKIIGVLCQPHSIIGSEAKITASIGITVVDEKHTSFSDLCKKGDMAMYKAKQSGKNQYHLYSDELYREYMHSLNVVSDLEFALGNGLLDVYYQPKINLATNTIDGAEALLRWNRGNTDGIGPAEFIPIIESTELIHSIGAWVLNEACRACKSWQQPSQPIKVAVNVSALQLTRSNFYQIVVDALEQNDLPPELLEIELTEYSLISEAPIVKTQLESLKKLGVDLAIDDFGTGYSNIVYLTQLKIDVLKLDRQLITQIDKTKDQRVIVSALVKMAKELDMKIVAEGIETEAEQLVVKDLKCDYGQGYLWSKAIPSAQLVSMISQEKVQPSVRKKGCNLLAFS